MTNETRLGAIRDMKFVLEKEGIDIRKSKELVKEKDLKGELVEIENIGERLISLLFRKLNTAI